MWVALRIDQISSRTFHDLGYSIDEVSRSVQAGELEFLRGGVSISVIGIIPQSEALRSHFRSYKTQPSVASIGDTAVEAETFADRLEFGRVQKEIFHYDLS
jgi:hypothetical protein